MWSAAGTVERKQDRLQLSSLRFYEAQCIYLSVVVCVFVCVCVGGGGGGGFLFVECFYQYSAILLSRADWLRPHVILHEWLWVFIARLWISTEVVYLQRWHMAGATWNCCRLGAFLCTPYNHASCHFMQSHIRRLTGIFYVLLCVRPWCFLPWGGCVMMHQRRRYKNKVAVNPWLIAASAGSTSSDQQ